MTMYAPEVTLGLPLSEAVDMLVVGWCAFPLVSTSHMKTAYHWMKATMHLLGQLEDHLLSAETKPCSVHSEGGRLSTFTFQQALQQPLTFMMKSETSPKKSHVLILLPVMTIQLLTV